MTTVAALLLLTTATVTVVGLLELRAARRRYSRSATPEQSDAPATTTVPPSASPATLDLEHLHHLADRLTVTVRHHPVDHTIAAFGQLAAACQATTTEEKP